VTDRAPEHPDRSGEILYHERLSVPWWWWLLGPALAVLLAAEIHMGAPGVRAWLPYLLLPLAVLAALAWLGRLPVRVRGGELWVDDAHLPLRFVADVEALDETGWRALLGPAGDPTAFVVLRPWVRTAVAVALCDPDDPTPYWLVSTRNPQRLAEVLDRARAAQ
jgi:hypothetical protein